MNSHEVERARPRSRRRWVMVLALFAIATGCTAVETRHYQADTVPLHIYVWIYKQPTKQIVIVNDMPFHATWQIGCSGDERCTLDFLRDRVNLSWAAGVPLVTDYDEFFRHSNAADLREALDSVRGTDRCLLADRNWVPWSDAHNWTWGMPGNGSCKAGENVTS